MRCFISIDIDDKLIEYVVGVQEKLKSANIDVKLVKPENMHFTLKFIGNVNENEIREIKNSLENITKNLYEFKISLGEVGFFSDENYVKVVWIGVEKGNDEIMHIMNDVNENVKFGKTSRLPHLTIARLKSKISEDKLVKIFDGTPEMNVCEMPVKLVKLKSSILTKYGPIYNDLSTFKLGDKHE